MVPTCSSEWPSGCPNGRALAPGLSLSCSVRPPTLPWTPLGVLLAVHLPPDKWGAPCRHSAGIPSPCPFLWQLRPDLLSFSTSHQPAGPVWPGVRLERGHHHPCSAGLTRSRTQLGPTSSQVSATPASIAPVRDRLWRRAYDTVDKLCLHAVLLTYQFSTQSSPKQLLWVLGRAHRTGGVG